MLLAGAGEFLAAYFIKGGDKDPLRIYTEENGGGWTLQTGSVSDVADLHYAGKNIIYIERTVRFKLADFSSLGWDLALSAITINLAFLLKDVADASYLFVTLSIQVIIAFITYFILQGNQKARPDQKWLGRLTAVAAIFFGIVAMFLSLLVLDERIVNTLF